MIKTNLIALNVVQEIASHSRDLPITNLLRYQFLKYQNFETD